MPVKPSSHSPDDELGRLVGLSLSRQQADRDGNGGEPCLDAEVLASYADGGLSAAARAEADRHLAACGWCRRALLFQVEADPDRVIAPAEVDDADESVGVVLRPAPAAAATGSVGHEHEHADERQPGGPGTVLAWPGMRRAARTWLPLAATVIVAAGLWFAFAAERSAPARPVDALAPAPASGAKPAGEAGLQAKADSRLQEVIATAKPGAAAKPKESAPRPFASEEANRALADRTNAAPKDEKEARAGADSSVTSGAAASSTPAAPAPAPTFRAAAPPESTMARAKTAPQSPALTKSNPGGQAGGVVGGQASGQAEAPPPPPRPAENFARQAPANPAAPEPAPTQAAQAPQQAATNVNVNQAGNQFQVSGPTNAQSNVNVNAANAAQNAGTQNAGPNAGTQNAAGQNAADQSTAGANAAKRAGATGDRADRDESRRREGQRAANEAPAPAPAAAAPAPAPPPAPARVGEVASEAKAGAAGASADTAGGRAVTNEVVTVVTSPFPNVLRSSNGRRWWRIRDGNTIEGSFDGGFTWTVEYSDPAARIARGAVSRTDDCWMVGADGLVLRFQSGRGWTRVTAPTTRALTSVTAASARAATVTDESGQRYQTTDGGLTWRPARR